MFVNYPVVKGKVVKVSYVIPLKTWWRVTFAFYHLKHTYIVCCAVSRKIGDVKRRSRKRGSSICIRFGSYYIF